VTPDLKVKLDRPALRVRRERRVNKAQRDRLDWRGQKAIWAQPGACVCASERMPIRLVG
jgi:hypothetical protein